MSLINRNIILIDDFSSDDFECTGGKLRVKFPSSGGGGVSAMFYGKVDTDTYLKTWSSHMSGSDISPFVVPFDSTITSITLSNKNVDAQGDVKVEVNGVVVYTWVFNTGVASTTDLITGLNIPVSSGDTVAIFGDKGISGNIADTASVILYM